jgi:hypothetical protein
VLSIHSQQPALNDDAMGGNAMHMTRRNVLAAAAGVAALAVSKETFGGWEPSEAYPDPAIKVTQGAIGG